MDEITLKALAKINLGLDVVRRGWRTFLLYKIKGLLGLFFHWA